MAESLTGRDRLELGTCALKACFCCGFGTDSGVILGKLFNKKQEKSGELCIDGLATVYNRIPEPAEYVSIVDYRPGFGSVACHLRD